MEAVRLDVSWNSQNCFMAKFIKCERYSVVRILLNSVVKVDMELGPPRLFVVESMELSVKLF